MKSLKPYIIVIIVSVIFCFDSIAQAKTVGNVPESVADAFKVKYPNATVKKWDLTGDVYTARAKDDHGKYFASFDKKGNWINTITKYKWPGHLTPVVKAAFKKSGYGAWHVYGINIIESPSGEIYQVLVDDASHRINANHQELFTANHLLEFKADGALLRSKDIN